MPTWENLNDFLVTETAGGFAVPAVLSFDDWSKPARTINGIFDELYIDATLGEYHADTGEPRFTCKMVDVADVRRGDYLTISGKRYSIMSAPQGDGTGLAILRLEIDGSN